MDVTGMSVAGREELQAAASTALAQGSSVLLLGEAGVGKSTMLSSLVAGLSSEEIQVLTAAPSESDGELPFVTLIDLLDAVPDVVFHGLRQASRRAVDTALLRHAPPEGDVDRLAVRSGVLELLRLVAEIRPTVLMIDDLQWVDPASAEVLTFAVELLKSGSVRMVAAERVSGGEHPRCRSLMPAGTVELRVDPLPDEVLSGLLLERGRGLVSRPLAARICELAGGNPLFAFEVADALVRRGAPPGPGERLPVPARLEPLMQQRLAQLPDAARDTVRVAAAAARPTLPVLIRAGCASAATDLATAEVAGVVTSGGGDAVTFAHPLLRAAVYADMSIAARMGVHGRLAEAVADPIDRARHLALATAAEDEAVASALTEAAALARRRGAAGTAFELAGLAAQRTPGSDLTSWAERKLAQGWYAYAAGLVQEAEQTARDVISAGVPRPVRARAWLVLLEALGNTIGQAGDELEAALADAAGDQATEPWVRVHLAVYHNTWGRMEQGLAEAMRAADAAAATGDAEAEVRATCAALDSQARLGINVETMVARAGRLLEQRPDLGGAACVVYFEQARLLHDQDRYTEARDVLRRAARLAEEVGGASEIGLILQMLMRVELKLGHCEEAMVLAARI
jgi:tetratricopeptide (TPR) repeat protein